MNFPLPSNINREVKESHLSFIFGVPSILATSCEKKLKHSLHYTQNPAPYSLRQGHFISCVEKFLDGFKLRGMMGWGWLGARQRHEDEPGRQGGGTDSCIRRPRKKKFRGCGAQCCHPCLHSPGLGFPSGRSGGLAPSRGLQARRPARISEAAARPPRKGRAPFTERGLGVYPGRLIRCRAGLVVPVLCSLAAVAALPRHR